MPVAPTVRVNLKFFVNGRCQVIPVVPTVRGGTQFSVRLEYLVNQAPLDRLKRR